MITSALQNAGVSNNWMDRAVDLELTQFNPALVACMRNFNLASNEQPETLRTHLSILNFMAPSTESFEYKELQKEGQMVFQAFASGTDNKKVSGSSQSKLCLTGKNDELHDIVTTACNWRTAFQAIIQDYDKGELPQMQALYLSHLTSAQGKRWMKKFRHSQAAFTNILMEYQAIISAFVRPTNNFNYIEALRNNQDLDHKIFEEAIVTAKSITNNLAAAIGRGELLDYRHAHCNTLMLFPSSSKNNNDTSHQDKKAKIDNSSRLNNNQPPARTMGRPNRPTPGMLIYSGTGRAPTCPIRMKSRPESQTEERLCEHFLYQGMECRFGDTCIKPHVSNFDKIPATKQNDFKAWVQHENNIAFAPGKGPSGRQP